MNLFTPTQSKSGRRSYFVNYYSTLNVEIVSDAPMLFECNDTCCCNAITCRNRVVQKGMTQRFQIFKTEQKGWGLKTLRFIPKGTFVCEYVGEILTDNAADAREDDSFLFAISNNVSRSHIILFQIILNPNTFGQFYF